MPKQRDPSQTLNPSLAQLREAGLEISFSVRDAAAASGRDPSSVYREFRTKDDLKRGLLVLAVEEPRSEAHHQQLRSQLDEFLSQRLPPGRRVTAAVRRSLVSELCDLGARLHSAALDESQAWKVGVAIRGVVLSKPPDLRDKDLLEAVRKGASETISFYATIYDTVRDRLAVRERWPGATIGFANVAAAIADGAALRRAFDPEGSWQDVDTGDGKTRSLLGVAIEALVLRFFEL